MIGRSSPTYLVITSGGITSSYEWPQDLSDLAAFVRECYEDHERKLLDKSE